MAARRTMYMLPVLFVDGEREVGEATLCFERDAKEVIPSAERTIRMAGVDITLNPREDTPSSLTQRTWMLCKQVRLPVEIWEGRETHLHGVKVLEDNLRG